jgi:predicted O-methyltransferase YrrM
MNRTEEILQFIPDKREDKNTTSLKFKTDLINYFDKLSLKNCLEVGTYIGYSTRILSFLFDEVTTIDSNENYLVNAKSFDMFAGRARDIFMKEYTIDNLCMYWYEFFQNLEGVESE